MLPDVRAVSWDHPASLAATTPGAAKGAAPYRARLTLWGTEVWRCRHAHRDGHDARRCGFRTWRLLCEWLAADDVAA
jgi:hypothetical protein